MKPIEQLIFAIIILVFSNTFSIAQTNFYQPLKLDTVSWSYDDFGKMWTFDNVPIEKFEKKYGFKPTEEWLDDVQKSALQFGGGCSAAFVSEDGLIMTNHHCGRGQLYTVEAEGENILRDGFYAHSLEEERKINNLFVDQLLLIEDITDIIKSFTQNAKSEDEQVKLRDQIKDSLVTKYNEETGLNCRIVTLYHGGKYSLYGYKRYNDIRLVMAPDFQIAATGWDWDNFTYPRYELDFMFYRAYDDEGKPIKTNNYFSWSKKGAEENEPIFVVGRPGSTDRLYSFAQLEYLRDFVYPTALIGFNEIYEAYFNHYHKHLENEDLLNDVMGWGNARKSYAGRLAGLNNEFIMKKKKSFQEDLISKTNADPSLYSNYGHIWKSIDSVVAKLSNYSIQNNVTRFNRFLRPEYYDLAFGLIKLAREKEKPDEERANQFSIAKLDSTLNEMFPKDLDEELEDNILLASINFLNAVLDKDDPILVNILENKKGKEAADYLKSKSKIITKEGFINLAQQEPEDILNSADPFIRYMLYIENLSKELNPKVRELSNKLSVLNELLGELVYHVFGNNIPPDATSTLRISDGVIKGYEYNGTIAPGKTTYYGLWDRYESFNKKTYPWGLHERWQKVPAELDLATDIGFASTNDIVGGNSGSSVININKEVVGLVHDGNIESLAGHTIFLEENNRTVASDSDGIIEALRYIYKADKLVEELLMGKL